MSFLQKAKERAWEIARDAADASAEAAGAVAAIDAAETDSAPA